MLPVILRGAFSDISGYGSLCRYIARALHSAGIRPAVHDLRCERFSFYVPSSAKERDVLNDVRSTPTPDPSKSIVLDITIPDLFNHCFKADAGYTMIECTQIPPRWTMSCLEMDAVFVPGPFGRSVFEKFRGLHVKEVAPGFDTESYRWVPEDRFGVWGEIKREPFKFVVTGHLLHSTDDRKGIKQLVRCWAREFKDDPDVGLVLKTQVLGHDFGDRMDLMDILWRILEQEKLHPMLERISVLHRNYTSDEMATVYSHPSIKAFVSPTHGEGVGLNMLECASCGGIPVIATDFSEHVNFLPSDLFVPLTCDMVPIPEEYHRAQDSPYPEEASWASVRDDVLMEAMRVFYVSESETPRKRVPGEIMPGLSLEAFGKRLSTALESVVPGSRRKKDPHRVHVGSGIDPLEGWFHIEEKPMESRRVDVACDPRTIPLPEGSVCEVEVSNLDMMTDEDAARALYECFRILRPGGSVHLVVTDCEKVMTTMLDEEAGLMPHAFEYLKRALTGAVNLWTRRRVLKILSRVGFDGAAMDEADSRRRPSDEGAEKTVREGFVISMGAHAVKPA